MGNGPRRVPIDSPMGIARFDHVVPSISSFKSLNVNCYLRLLFITPLVFLSALQYGKGLRGREPRG